jgi:hypothetical protein
MSSHTALGVLELAGLFVFAISGGPSGRGADGLRRADLRRGGAMVRHWTAPQAWTRRSDER